MHTDISDGGDALYSITALTVKSMGGLSMLLGALAAVVVFPLKTYMIHSGLQIHLPALEQNIPSEKKWVVQMPFSSDS